MIINSSSLSLLYTSFSTAFRDGLGMVKPTWDMIAMKIPSTTGKQEYGWLGDLPNVREWLGERAIQNLGLYDYEIKNRDWELTIGVKRNDIMDDNLGIYTPLFNGLGKKTMIFPDQLLWPMLQKGFTAPCYDGQPYFSATHPVLDVNGQTIELSNVQAGAPAGPAWYLFDTQSVFKPLIYQERKPFDFVRMDAPTDEEVFSRKLFRYGVDGRSNAGYGFWQIAYASQQPLNAANYQIARQSMMALTGDYGVPIGLMPDLLVVPPTLENAGLQIINSELTVVTDVAGALTSTTNVYKGTAKLHVSPFLS